MGPFQLRAQLNALVIRAVAEGAFGSSSADACNRAAEALLDSPVHGRLTDLADAVADEISKAVGTVSR
jgi:hypothetical protein